MYRTWRRICSLLLSMLLALSCIPVIAVYAPEEHRISWEQIPNDSVEPLLNNAAQEAPAQEAEALHTADEFVRVSIVLSEPSAMERGGTFTKGSLSTMETVNYRSTLRAKQDTLSKRISTEALGGKTLDVVWNITLAANIISANVRYGDIAAIRDVVGVEDVFLETRYEPVRVSKADEPMMSIATDMTGAQQVWSTGYNGAGSIVAVVDTGLDTEHQSFNADAFDYAIGLDNELRRAEGKADVDLLTQDEVSAVLGQLNAKINGNALTISQAYRTTKIPYAYNYVDKAVDVTHENDTQGEHGSHVSGIATANRFIKSGNTYLDALDPANKIYTQGDAPDAQLLVMKVFGSNGGAYDSDYFVAIEDAIVLGADVVNLSLGSSVPGFAASDSRYAEIMAEIRTSNMVWANSAGNSYAWATFSNGEYLYAEDVSYSTGGSPGTYENTLSVASVDNKGFTGEYLTVDGQNIFFNETQGGYGNPEIHTIAGTYGYVAVDGFGDDWDNIDLSGKVAVCSRGATSFADKANKAAAKGASAVIIYNNAPGTISMNLSGYEHGVPVISITQADGTYMKSKGTKYTSANGIDYYVGSVTIADGVAVNDYGDLEYYEMSDFSSWGVPGDLSMKPEITAPGGNIYSVFGYNKTGDDTYAGGHDKYENMSGTSMASPQVAGLTALLAQYIRDENVMTAVNGGRPVTDQLTRRQLMQSLLMSTSAPLREEAGNGEYYSILKQGSGLIDVEAAINARSYIMMDSHATKSNTDGKVKVELGDDPDRTGSYSATFTLYNFATEAQTFSLYADFFTQDVTEYDGVSYLDYVTAPLAAEVTWSADGRVVNPALDLRYDYDANGVVGRADAQKLLDAIVADNVSAAIPAGKTDNVDETGGVDTHDVYALLELLNGASVTVPAGGHVTITADFDLKNSISAFDYEKCGAYVEGFLYVQEADNWEGARGVTHSIPVLGYYGSWTDPSMFDQGSLVENRLDGGKEPYVASNASYKSSNNKGFLAKNLAGEVYFLGGNPVVADDPYLPERDAMNGEDTLTNIRYTLIRNTAPYGRRLIVTDDTAGETISTNVLKDAAYSTFFSLSSGAWAYAYSSMGVNLTPGPAREGHRITVAFQAAPEYYLDENGAVLWNKVGKGAQYAISFTVDSVAPTVNSVEPTYDGGKLATLTVKARDAQYIAAVALMNERGEVYEKNGNRSIFGSNPNSPANTEETYVFDLLDYFDSLNFVDQHLLIQVYDYAGNLSTWRINTNYQEQYTTDPSISLDRTEIQLIKGKAARLTASVGPWGIEEDGVVWTSSDEAVATVNDGGVVTAVGEGTCTITATTVATPQASATCEVAVFDRTLDAALWDTNGNVSFSEFTLSSVPDYTELSGEVSAALASAAYGKPHVTGTHSEGSILEGTYHLVNETAATLYAASFDTNELSSQLYEVNENGYALTEVASFSALGLGAMDFCSAPNMTVSLTGSLNDYLICVYASFVLVIDAKYSGPLTSLKGYVDFSEYLFPDTTGGYNYLIGIAYAGGEDLIKDWVYLLDMQGNLYKTSLRMSGISLGGLVNAVSLGDDVTYVCNLGYSVDVPYLQSLYYDGQDLYWTRYDSGENDVDLIMVKDVDSKSKRQIFEVGSFENGVWPIGGLYQSGNHLYGLDVTDLESGDGEVIDPTAGTSAVGGPIDLSAVRVRLEALCPAPGYDVMGVSEPAGSLNAVRDGGREPYRPQSVSVADSADADVDGVVTITADANGTTNGLYTVSYDPAELELVAHSDSVTGLTAEQAESGALTFGYVVNGESCAFAKDASILSLSFKLKENVTTGTVVVTTVENNSEHPGSSKTVYVGVPLGHEVTLNEIGTAFTGGSAPVVRLESKTWENGQIELIPDELTFTVEFDKPCMVLVKTTVGGVDSYEQLAASPVQNSPNKYRFSSTISGSAEIIVVLKGDLDLSGVTSSDDASKLTKGTLKSFSQFYVPLNALETALADLNLDGLVNSDDASILTKATLKSFSQFYVPLTW